ncbi:hypothetical protein MNBD_UNCLBAC01-993 [hydrothermal vent metagenome]|uniref:Polymerase beta nucleotidyltransferase domain-containing protein n=1 Tax=hydrothermal vent metagenome TaxID=652676 RepID=A0A3B1DB87_9ZZZZ
MKFGLPEETIQKICHLLESYPQLDEVKIYGSRAMGNYEKGSDIDLAFYAKTNKSLKGSLLTELDALSTPYLFDITDYYQTTHVSLKEHIDRAGKIFYINRRA